MKRPCVCVPCVYDTMLLLLRFEYNAKSVCALQGRSWKRDAIVIIIFFVRLSMHEQKKNINIEKKAAQKGYGELLLLLLR